MKNIFKFCAKAFVLVFSLALSVQMVLAWAEPQFSPADGNLAAPINVGVTSQTKSGGIGAYSFTGNFMHMNTISGISSPLRGDIYSNGTDLFYYNGSSWDDLTATGLSLWTASGSNIYNSNTGNVGIGTSSPAGKLNVVSASGAEGIRSTNPKGNSHFPFSDGNSYVSGTNVILRADGNTGNTERMRVTPTGLVGIGTASPAYSLDVVGGGHFTTNLAVAGTVYASAFIYSSDERLKNNINNLQNVNDILKISPVTFNWNKDRNADIGVIAQEVEKYFPEFVKTGEDGFKAVDYPKLVVPLIGAVKEQQQKIDDLEKRLEALENK